MEDQSISGWHGPARPCTTSATPSPKEKGDKCRRVPRFAGIANGGRVSELGAHAVPAQRLLVQARWSPNESRAATPLLLGARLDSLRDWPLEKVTPVGRVSSSPRPPIDARSPAASSWAHHRAEVGSGLVQVSFAQAAAPLPNPQCTGGAPPALRRGLQGGSDATGMDGRSSMDAGLRR